MKASRTITMLAVLVLALSVAVSAEVLNWYGFDWETQPLEGYTGGNVTIGVDAHLWTYSGGANKIQWFVPYNMVDPLFQERYGVAKLIIPPERVGQTISSLQINVYDGQMTGKIGWSIVLKNQAGRIMDIGVRPYFGQAKIRTMVYDGVEWQGNPYLMTRTKSGNDYYFLVISRLPDGNIHVKIDAVQNTIPASATWTSPVPFGDIESVYLVSAAGLAENVYFKWTKFVPQWETGKVVGMSTRAAYDPIMSLAAFGFSTRMWGRIPMEGYDGNSFLIDDGSGKPVKVYAPAHGQMFGTYVTVVGKLDPTTNPPTLSSDAANITFLSY